MDIPKDFLSKEFLSQFKTQEDVEAFMSELHVKVYEQMLQGEMDSHLGYEKGSKDGFNTGNSRNGSYSKKIQGTHGESIIEVPRDREGEFEPVVEPYTKLWTVPENRIVLSTKRTHKFYYILL